MDAKEFAQHHERVVFVRRIPAWMSTEELGRQVQYACSSWILSNLRRLALLQYGVSIPLYSNASTCCLHTTTAPIDTPQKCPEFTVRYLLAKSTKALRSVIHTWQPFYLVFSNHCGNRQVKTEGGKYVRIAASDAVNNRNDDFARSAYIVYDSPRKATSASQKLNKLRVFHRSKPAGEYSVATCGSTVQVPFTRSLRLANRCW